MTLMRQLTLNSCHFQTCNLGMSLGADGVGEPGLFYVYYGTGPSEAGEAIGYHPNW